jgi:hypothetical protein
MKKYHVTVPANSLTVTRGIRNNPVATPVFKQWMKDHNTGRVTTAGWKLVKTPEPHFVVTWCFEKLDHALLFKLTFL